MAMIPFEIKFGGGLNNRDTDFDILTTQASDLLNVVFDGIGTIMTRDGYAQEGDTVAGSDKCVGLGSYKYSDAAGTITRTKYAVFGTDIYKDVAGTWTAQSLTLTDSIDGQFVQAANELYYFNGTDAVENLSNTTWSTLASGAPMSGGNNIGRYARYRGGMLFVSGTNILPTQVYVSGDTDGSLDTPEDFSGGWVYEIGKNDGLGIVTGLEVIGNFTVILKERGIYVMTGPTGDTQSVIQKVEGIGCAAPKSIATDGRFVFFQSFDGHVYAFDGATVWKTSEVISGTVDSSIKLTEIDQSAGVYDSTRDLYILSVVQAGAFTVPNYQLVLDLKQSSIQSRDHNRKRWSVFEGPPANVWLDISDDAGTNAELFFGDSGGTGKIFKMFSGTNDDSNAIKSFYITKNFDFENPQRQKVFRDLYFELKQVGNWNITTQYAINGGGLTGTLPDAIDVSLSGSTLPVTLPFVLEEGFLATNNLVNVGSTGRYIKMKFSTNTADNYFTAYSATLYFRFSKRRLPRSIA